MRIYTGFLALALLIVAGCGPSGGDYTLVSATASDVQDHLRAQEGKVRIVNFWATWCAPCVKEFPDFVKLQQDYAERGVEVTFVSVDLHPDEETERAVREFLDRMGVSGQTFIQIDNGEPFVEALAPEWGGTIPATLIFSPNGTKAAYWEGATTYEHLAEVVETILASDTAL